VTNDFNKEFEAKGFTLAARADVGATKMMTVGFEVHHPADLAGKSCFFLTGDAVAAKVLSVLGRVTPRQLTVSEISPLLAAGSIDVVVAPPLAAEQLQWASHITHVGSMTVGYDVGGLIFSKPRLQGLPECGFRPS
jgi:TRAP-type C4-dicarboxylate transport system substrate-binding protein